MSMDTGRVHTYKYVAEHAATLALHGPPGRCGHARIARAAGTPRVAVTHRHLRSEPIGRSDPISCSDQGRVRRRGRAYGGGRGRAPSPSGGGSAGRRPAGRGDGEPRGCRRSSVSVTTTGVVPGGTPSSLVQTPREHDAVRRVDLDELAFDADAVAHADALGAAGHGLQHRRVAHPPHVASGVDEVGEDRFAGGRDVDAHLEDAVLLIAGPSRVAPPRPSP